jgi:putative nucleotidyltransferase with HDIG domain
MKEIMMSETANRAIFKEVIASAEKLPPFPDVTRKVMPLVQRMAPVNEIEKVIRYDQAITARVLAMSQSTYYSRGRNVSSLRDAIVALGQRQLIQVVMAACSAQYFSAKSTGYDLKEGELWQHAVATALMAEKVAKRIGFSNVLTVYTAALLHDIGKTVLNLYVNTYFDLIINLLRSKQLRFLDAEREVLGIDHQQLGAIIARHWRFPAEVVMAIGHHHSPQHAKEHRQVVALIYVANRMVSGMGIGCGVDGFWQSNQDDVFLELGITTRMVDQFMADTLDDMEEAKQFLTA